MSLNDRDPEKLRAWRERGARNYQEKRRQNPGKGLRSKGAKARREQVQVNAFRFAVRARAQGFCELQTPACLPYRHEGHHAHHKRLLSQGGQNVPENGLWLCFPAHRWVHAHPAESYEQGWMLRHEDGAA